MRRVAHRLDLAGTAGWAARHPLDAGGVRSAAVGDVRHAHHPFMPPNK
ncbi:hypothetical protein JNUCC0626_49940 (plasmid) [Lentzea sp. JNUCC 0626]